MYNVQKPNTPHNTGQFITHNFNIGRSSKILQTPISLEELQADLTQELFDTENIDDDFCISGGTMTGNKFSHFRHPY